MTTSLKPCPFCGEHAHMKELETAHGSTLYGVSCPTEGCLGFAMETYSDTPGQAVAAPGSYRDPDGYIFTGRCFR